MGWPGDTPARPVGAAGDSVPSASGPDPTGAPAARRLQRVVGIVVLLLVLVIGLPALLVDGEGPEDAAAEFLDAVVAAGGATIRAHAAPTGNSLEIALTDAVLDRARDRVRDYEIEDVTVRGGVATVTAELRSSRGSGQVVLRLDRRLRGPLRPPDWMLRPVSLPVLLLEMPVTGRALVVNDQVLPIPAAERTEQGYGVAVVRLRVLPGTYAISTQAVAERLVPQPAHVAVPPVLGHWVSAPVPLELDLTVAGKQQLLVRARTALETCLASTSPRPPGCPLAAPDSVTAEGSWELVEGPDLTVGGHDRGFYDVHASFEAAFTPAPADGARPTDETPSAGAAPPMHRLAVEARAVALLSRHGQLAPHWTVPPRGPRPGVDGRG